MRRVVHWTLAGAALLAVSFAILCRVGLDAPMGLAGPVEHGQLEATWHAFPPGSQRVEVPVEGDLLRGVFVPARRAAHDAPVVLHLMHATGSVRWRENFDQLARAGFASLALDWRGVGDSSGDHGARHLGPDVRGMYAEARRRAAGGCVIVRAASLGTLAWAELVASGARPAAAVLVAPVDATSAAPRLAAHARGPLAGALAALVLRPVVEADVAHELAAFGGRLLVLASPEDLFLGPEDCARFARAVLASGGTCLQPSGGHADLVRLSAALLPGERALLDAVHPDPAGDPFARWLVPLDEATRRALGARGDTYAVIEALQHLASGLGTLPLEQRGEPLAFEDPAGDLPWAQLLRAGRGLRSQRERPGLWLEAVHPLHAGDDPVASFAGADAMPALLALPRVGQVELAARSWVPSTGGFDAQLLALLPDAAWREIAGELELPERDARRQLARLMLFALGLPDRVRSDARGRLVLEAWEDGAWRALDLGPGRAGPAEGERGVTR